MGAADTRGLIPRLCDAIFERSASRLDASTTTIKVEVSYMEIYNEKVTIRILLLVSQFFLLKDRVRLRQIHSTAASQNRAHKNVNRSGLKKAFRSPRNLYACAVLSECLPE